MTSGHEHPYDPADCLPPDLIRAQQDLAAYIRVKASPDSALLRIMQSEDTPRLVSVAPVQADSSASEGPLARIQISRRAARPGLWVCPDCGGLLGPMHSHCHSCGRKVGAMAKFAMLASAIAVPAAAMKAFRAPAPAQTSQDRGDLYRAELSCMHTVLVRGKTPSALIGKKARCPRCPQGNALRIVDKVYPRD